MSAIRFDVAGRPPSKAEAQSLLGRRKGEKGLRAMRLLEAARAAREHAGINDFGDRPLGMDFVLRCPRDRLRSDATNVLGGVGDVLQEKRSRLAAMSRPPDTSHLEEAGLLDVYLFDDDAQIEQLHYLWEEGPDCSYSVHIWALDDQSAPDPNVDAVADAGETQRLSFTHDGLLLAGFKGFVTFAELADGALDRIPRVGGVYTVLRSAEREPTFRQTNPGGRFKGKDPTLARAALAANWVDGAAVIYIGKSDDLGRRLKEFMRYGQGAPIGHWGGRLIWQLADSDDLLVAWRACEPGQVAKEVEGQLLAQFRAAHGQAPFANDPHLLGR